MQRLEGLLAEDIAFYADGGANVNVVKKICTGNAAVADLLTIIYQKFQQHATIRFIEVNHQPALLFRDGDRLTSCLVFDISPVDNRITRINSVVDPEKLKNFS
jgi:RNA polymerase sigma-70 factor (ECF subfamily)